MQFLVNGVPQHPSKHKTLTVPEIARLNIPVHSIDRVEIIRGPMSVIYGNNAFLGVVNVVTNDAAAAGSRVSLGAGTGGTGLAFARWAGGLGDASGVLNLGVQGDDGLAGDYAQMLSPARRARLDPRMHGDMDGDMDQWAGSLDFSGRWRGVTLDLRATRRDYGVYAFTPAFDDGSRIRLDTLHGALGIAHRFSDDLGLRTTAIYSEEFYDAYRLDFLRPDLVGGQRQGSRRAEVELDLHWQPTAAVNLLAGYRLLHLDQVRNRAAIVGLVEVVRDTAPVTTQDLFVDVGWQASRQWRFTAGARLRLLPEAWISRSIDPLTGTRISVRAAPETTTPVTGRIAALWSPTPRQVLKLIWGTAAQDTDDQTTGTPERIATLEANYVLTGAGWLVNASLFRNELTNIQRVIQVVDPATGTYRSVDDNSGRWLTHGAELIAEARPLPALNLSASLTWQQTEDLTGPVAPGYSPAWLGKLRADWHRGPWTLAASGYYVDGMAPDWDFVAGPRQGAVARIGADVPAWWDLGVNLRWDPAGAGPWAAVHLTNLLGRENRYPANELTDLDLGLIGPARALVLTVGYAF